MWEPVNLRLDDNPKGIVATGTLVSIGTLHGWFAESGLFKNGDRVLLVEGEDTDEYRMFGWNFSYGYAGATYVDIERTIDS